MTTVIDEKYEIQQEIKRGGFGIIYRGTDLLFGKSVAIKAVDPSLLGEAKYIDMFQAEALHIARLNHHNIVHVFDIKRGDNGQFYIIMEFIDGPDLSQLLKSAQKSGKQIPLHLGVYIVAESCAGLDFAHNRRDTETNEPLNVVHQDISPSNIMITRNGEVKIIDFGMANLRRQQSKKKNEISVQGTLNYLAPEQLNGQTDPDRRTDIFSLGLVLYEIITGERLFASTSPQETITQLQSGKWDVSKLDALETPEKLRDAVKRALAPKPEERYPSANHMYMDLMHHLIMTAPASDFVQELSEFVGAAAPAEDTAPPTKAEPKKKPPTRKKAQSAKTTSSSKRRSAKKTRAKTAKKTENAVPAGATNDGLEDLIEISDQAVNELESQQSQEKVELKEATQTTEVEKLTRQMNQDSEKSASTKTDDAPKSKGRKAKPKRAKKEKAPPVEDEPVVEVLETENAQSAEPVSSFYTIMPEQKNDVGVADEGEDEELKTIIDVVRLSARSHKRGLLIGLFSLLTLFIGFAAADAFMQFTPFGVAIYDTIFPPAIKIESVPAGAQVFIDDKPLQQTTPLRIEEITPGVHKLMLTIPRFDPIVKSITVPGQGEQLKIAGEESRSASTPYVFKFKAQLELSSQPPGADVFINEVKLAQQTPTTVYWDVSEEPMRIRMSRPGFPTLEGMEIDGVQGAETISDRRFWKFQRLDNTKDHFAIEGVFRKGITINSNPARAEIYLDEDERPVGITGLSGSLFLTVGQHVITLRKGGYLPRRFSLDVDQNTPVELTESLSRVVRIFAKDANSGDDSDLEATLVELRSRDNSTKFNETTPTDVTLLPLRYTAVLRKKGHKDTYVQIPPDAKTIVARMKPETAAISIFIVDDNSNEPVNVSQVLYKIRGAQEREQQLGVSDPAGAVIGELPPGNYQFTVIKPGYEASTKNLRIRTDQQNRLTFRLTARK